MARVEGEHPGGQWAMLSMKRDRHGWTQGIPTSRTTHKCRGGVKAEHIPSHPSKAPAEGFSLCQISWGREPHGASLDTQTFWLEIC